MCFDVSKSVALTVLKKCKVPLDGFLEDGANLAAEPFPRLSPVSENIPVFGTIFSVAISFSS
jgi:hypothetical protein